MNYKSQILDIINLLGTLPNDGTLHLVLQLSENAGIFILDGNLHYIIAKFEDCLNLNITTESIRLQSNLYLMAFDDTATSFKEGFYNSVSLDIANNPNNIGNVEGFINLCRSHIDYMEGHDLEGFFNSLISMLQLPKEQNYKNLVGLFGELSLIKYTFENLGVDISSSWHKEGSHSKLDFSCSNGNIEVKTTSKESLSFSIKHGQLFGDESKNYLVAISAESNNSGQTVEAIINELLESKEYCNSFEFAVNIEKERRRVNPNDLKNKHFIIREMRLFKASSINPFKSVPDNIENLNYELNVLPYISEQLSLLKDICSTPKLIK